MAGWMERFRSTSCDPSAAHVVLADLNAGRRAVHVSIEGTYHTFATRVRLRSGAVTLIYPSALAATVQEGGWARVHLPDSVPPRGLRLQVSSARHGGSGAMAADIEHIVLLCGLASARLVKRLRKEQRVCTARYRDVALHLDSVAGTYRLLDMSHHGAKVRLPADSAQKSFPLGRRLERGTLQLGNRAKVPVDYAIRRYVAPGARLA